MLSKILAGAGKAANLVYIEDVFSTYLYTGNGSAQTIPNGIALGSSYGGSVYSSGTGYLTVPDNAAFEMAAGDFTVEAFFYCTALPGAGAFGDIITKGAAGIFQPYYIFIRDTGALVFYSSSTGSSWDVASNVSFGTIVVNTWYHVAVARQGSSIRMFLNGALINTITSSASLFDNTRAVGIGARSDGTEIVTGFISNARIVKGTAVYTSAFTVPASPLTAVSGTSLLTCQTPNAVLDYSSNAFTVTVTNAIAQNGGGPFTDSTANKGGLVWIKGRSGATEHALYDTTRGATFDLASNSTAAQTTQTTGLTAFNSNGFSIGALAKLNTNAATYTSWTFRDQAKFFDVVTYTGTGANRTVSHNLGSVPGCIMVKRTDTTADWQVYHRSLANTQYLVLNTTAVVATGATRWNSTTATDTVFSLGTDATVNASGGTYVAYLFAHNAGGFGATGTDNVISCGSYTGNGSATGPTVTLGYEPQWLLVKNTAAVTNWVVVDTMRGLPVGYSDTYTGPNLSSAEVSAELLSLTATGFQPAATSPLVNSNGVTYSYIAICRGPMKIPTSGTSVFGLNARTGTGAATTVTGGAGVTDLAIIKNRGSAITWAWTSRLTGTSYVESSSNSAETAAGVTILQANPWDVMDGVKVGTTSTITNASAATFINYLLRRAPGFFDIVCDTGTASQHTINHGLGVVPELIIRKKRNSGTNSDWVVWHSSFSGTGNYLFLNLTDAVASNTAFWTTTPPTASVFNLGTGSRVNNLNDTYITFLFASAPGVSKIGSYTGNGTSQTINCGFAAGARFVMIKLTSALGNWFIWDTARGIVSGNDPRLVPNTTAAEVTSADDIDPDNSGFIVNLASANVNVSGSSYIFLAIA